MLQNFEEVENSSSKAALWLFIGKDLTSSLFSGKIPKSLSGQTARMFIVLTIVLAVLRAFRSQHDFMGAVASAMDS